MKRKKKKMKLFSTARKILFAAILSICALSSKKISININKSTFSIIWLTCINKVWLIFLSLTVAVAGLKGEGRSGDSAELYRVGCNLS